MSGLSLKSARGDSIRLETDSGPVIITMLAPAHVLLKIQAPPEVRISRPDHPPPGLESKPGFSPPSVRYTRAELARAHAELCRTEGRTREDSRRIDAAGAILCDLIRRLDPREGVRRPE